MAYHIITKVALHYLALVVHCKTVVAKYGTELTHAYSPSSP